MKMDNEKQQLEIAQAIKTMRDNMPAVLELVTLQAAQIRAKYLALVAAGFSEIQALELCKS